MDVISEIQPGWEVVDSDGRKVGKVTEVSDGVVHIKESGLFGGEAHVPGSAIAEAEESTVRLAITRRDLEAGLG
jgi:hypothetical protein